VRVVVAFAGGTCSGKSFLATKVAGVYEPGVSLIRQDDFYPDRSQLSSSALAEVNFDSLASVDEVLYNESISRVMAGCNVSVPKYDSVRHARLDTLTEVRPAEILIIEGMHAIKVVEDVVRCSNKDFAVLRIFLECSTRRRKTRRLERESRGKTVLGNFEEYWRNICEPTFRSEVLPQRDRADIVVTSPIRREDLRLIIATIEKRPRVR
jgi:uridine kinase